MLDTATGNRLVQLQGHTDSVTALAFTPDGQRLARASADQTIRLWDLTRGQEVLTLHGHTDKVTALAFSPDGKHLASGCEDGPFVCGTRTGNRRSENETEDCHAELALSSLRTNTADQR